MELRRPNYVVGLSAIVMASLVTGVGCKNRSVHRDLKKDPSVILKGAPEDSKEDPTVTVKDPEKGGPTNPTVSSMCRYIDPSQNISEAIPGSPAGLAIPISNYTKSPELLTKQGSNISFNYTIFQRQDGSNKTLFWDSKSKGWFAVNYKATVQGVDSQACTITAVPTSSPTERTLNGCFDPETMITMADGSKKKIKDIQFNDHVKNPVTGKFGIVVRVTKGPEAGKGMYEVGFSNAGHVVVTSKHPFITATGTKTADELTVSDKIAAGGGQFKKITHLVKRSINKKQTVVNFALAGASTNDFDHLVEADGVVAGDLFLQEKLENLKKLKDSVASSK